MKLSIATRNYHKEKTRKAKIIVDKDNVKELIEYFLMGLEEAIKVWNYRCNINPGYITYGEHELNWNFYNYLRKIKKEIEQKELIDITFYDFFDILRDLRLDIS